MTAASPAAASTRASVTGSAASSAFQVSSPAATPAAPASIPPRNGCRDGAAWSLARTATNDVVPVNAPNSSPVAVARQPESGSEIGPRHSTKPIPTTMCTGYRSQRGSP
ncbi:MAG TPA: hypothetical protein VF142_08700, partial [Longimicrobium sp.]